jgi:hypothetical protein
MPSMTNLTPEEIIASMPPELLKKEKGFSTAPLKEQILGALKAKGGNRFLESLEAKDLVGLLKAIVQSELKVDTSVRPHEDFLKLADRLGTRDMQRIDAFEVKEP